MCCTMIIKLVNGDITPIIYGTQYHYLPPALAYLLATLAYTMSYLGGLLPIC